MTRVAHSLLFALLGSACTTTVADDPDDPPITEPAHCEVAPADAVTSVSEGGRARIALTVEGEVSGLTALASAGQARIEDTTLVAKPGYGMAGVSMSVTVQYDCAGTPQETTVDVPVHGIGWSSLPTWTPGVDGPLNREYGNVWIDAQNPDRMLAYGGFHYQPQQFTPANELWEYDLVNHAWRQLSPVGAPLRPGAGLALIGDSDAVYYGGLVDGNSTPYAVDRLDYSGDAPMFTNVVDGTGGLNGGTGDYQPSLVWDAPRNRLIAACGLNNAWGTHCRVRTIDVETGMSTTLEAVGEAPTGRNGHFWVHDVETERLILFSGDAGSPSCDCQPDTWALELSEEPVRWVRIAVDAPPVGRRNGAFALDPEGHRMFVWGGTPDGATAAPGIWALDLERGAERWHQVQPTGEAPPDRASGAMVYDAARSRMVMGFGNAAGNYTDLWSLAL